MSCIVLLKLSDSIKKRRLRPRSSHKTDCPVRCSLASAIDFDQGLTDQHFFGVKPRLFLAESRRPMSTSREESPRRNQFSVRGTSPLLPSRKLQFNKVLNRTQHNLSQHAQLPEGAASSPLADFSLPPDRFGSLTASDKALPVRGSLAKAFDSANDNDPNKTTTEGAEGSIANISARGGLTFESQETQQTSRSSEDAPPAPTKAAHVPAAENGAKTPPSTSVYSPGDTVRLIVEWG